MNAQEVKEFFANHWTVRKYQDIRMPAEHLDTILFAAQRAPTDATAQMYSFIRITDTDLKVDLARLSNNPHMAYASETFVICADIYRLKRFLEHHDYACGDFPSVGVHFAIGDAVMAGQNMLIAAEMLGYKGCWIGGILANLEVISDMLKLPKGVFPFAGLTLGKPAEEQVVRPRLSRKLVVHENTYQEPSAADLDRAQLDMAAITARGNWAQTLDRYFGHGGSMEAREIVLRHYLHRQGFAHVWELDELFKQILQMGYTEAVLRKKNDRIEAWVDQGYIAQRGEGETASAALKAAVNAAVENILK